MRFHAAAVRPTTDDITALNHHKKNTFIIGEFFFHMFTWQSRRRRIKWLRIINLLKLDFLNHISSSHLDLKQHTHTNMVPCVWCQSPETFYIYCKEPFIPVRLCSKTKSYSSSLLKNKQLVMIVLARLNKVPFKATLMSNRGLSLSQHQMFWGLRNHRRFNSFNTDVEALFK